MGIRISPHIVPRSPFDPLERIATFSGGNLIDYDISDVDVIRVTGAASLYSLAGGFNGRRVIVMNASGGAVAIGAAFGTDENKFIVPSDLTSIADGRAVGFMYDGTAQRWRVLNS